MRVEELMFGDWVQGFVPDSYSKIYGIFNEGRIAIIAEPNKTYIELSPEDVQPIHLTPEILEKNGFKSWEYGYIFKERIGICGQTTSASSPIEVIIYKGGHSVIMNPHEGKEFQGSIDSFHELQHALRLCGIEKEIAL